MSRLTTATTEYTVKLLSQIQKYSFQPEVTTALIMITLYNSQVLQTQRNNTVNPVWETHSTNDHTSEIRGTVKQHNILEKAVTLTHT